MNTYIIYCFNGTKFTIEAYSGEQAITTLNMLYGYSAYDVKAIRKEV